MGGRQTGWHAVSVDLGHPAVIAAATAVGYLVAYLDRLGEAVVYQIPLDYVTVSVTDALSRVSIVFVAVLLFVGVTRLDD